MKLLLRAGLLASMTMIRGPCGTYSIHLDGRVFLHEQKFLINHRSGGEYIRTIKAKYAKIIHEATGYCVVYVAGKHRRVHALVAEAVLGKKLPARAVVHHIDGDPSNNRADNLVICPSREYHHLIHQIENLKVKRLGVHKLPTGGWRAQASNGRKNVHIGCYDTKDEAIQAKLEVILHGHEDSEQELAKDIKSF